MRGVSFDKARGLWVARHRDYEPAYFKNSVDAREMRKAWDAVTPPRKAGGLHKGARGVYFNRGVGWVARGPAGARLVCDTEQQALAARAAWERGEEPVVVRARRPGRPRKGTGT